MKSQLNKILKITFVILFFSLSKSYSVEDLSEFTDAISEAREGFDKVSAASTDQSKIIDEAFKEIDKATAIAQEAINNNYTEDAIKTLEFVERSLTDVESIIPQEFGSDMSNIDISALSKEDMDTVNELTAQMKSSKAVKEKEFKSNLIELNLKGIDTASISEKLNELGVNTIQLDIVLDKDKKIDTWTKQDWADSYTGSVLSFDGSKVVNDKEASSRIAELETKLQKNTALIESKKNELSSLSDQLNPLNSELESLNNRKSLLTTQYNLEIEKLSTANLNNLETQKSIEISDKLKSELDSISSEVLEVEKKSATINENISKLNLDIDFERNELNKISSNLSKAQKDLNNTLSTISSKQSQLESLINNNFSRDNQILTQQLGQINREKDFIEAQFEKSIDKEVAALERYYSALGDIESDYYEDELEFSLREVGVILDADPRKARAFEIEKYATYAGLSEDLIQKGVDAVNKDDWNTQKDVFKEIYTGLAKSPNWNVDVPSEAELRVMVEEEKAIQAATLASLDIEEMNKNWNENLKEQAKNYQSLAELRLNTVKYAATWEGMPEHEPLQKEINNILESNQDFDLKQKEISQIKNTISQIQNSIDSFDQKERESLYAEYEKSVKDSKIAFEKNIDQAKKDFQKLQEEISEHNQNSNWYDKDWVNKREELYDKHVETFYDRFERFSPEEFVDPTAAQVAEINKLNKELSSLSIEVNSIKNEASRQARQNLTEAIEEAKTKYNEIMSQENPEYTAVKQKVTSILKDVPTFADKAESLAGLDAVSLRAQLADLAAGTKTEAAALDAARKAMSEIGKTSGNQFMTGPYWEMSNVKAAAIVRSKKYDYVDDYAYINAYYEEPIQFETKDRKDIEAEFKELLGNNNPKLNALNNQAINLKSQISNNNRQLTEINKNIASLEKEIASIKTSEKDIQTQISKLSKDFNSKQSLIAQKTQSLNDLQKNLDPLNDKLAELESQKNELNNNMQIEINEISKDLEKSPATKTAEIDKLNADYKSQIASLDQQITNFENQANELNQSAKALNDEIKSYEIETPQITEQLAKLSEDINNLKDIKANLAMATAKNIGIKVDEKAVKSLGKIEGKAIISIKGTELVRVVDEKLLKEDAAKFIDPISSFSLNTKIYTAEAVIPEVFLIEELTVTHTQAKAAREAAREKLASIESKAGASETEIKAAEEAVNEAKYAEIAAGQAIVTGANFTTGFTQQATLEKLKAIRQTPGMNKWDVRRAEAAIKAAEAQIAGKSNNYNSELSKIANEEAKWNAWRADLYQKDIEIAKAAGKTREVANLQRDLKNFQDRLVKEKEALSAMQKQQSGYLEILSSVSVKNAALTGVSLQEATNSSIQSSVQSSSKSISAEAQATVQAEASAIQSAGASTQQSSAYAAAKTARLEARAAWDAALASGNKAAAQAAEDAFMAARDVEQVAGQQAVAAAAAASAAAQAASEVASVAQEASQAAQEAAAEVADVVESAKSAQQAALDALYELEALPGATGFHSQEVQAAIEQMEAEMEGRSYSYLGKSSYEEAMAEIERMEGTGKSVVECLSQEGC